jgi:hypothetical protein
MAVGDTKPGSQSNPDHKTGHISYPNMLMPGNEEKLERPVRCGEQINLTSPNQPEETSERMPLVMQHGR